MCLLWVVAPSMLTFNLFFMFYQILSSSISGILFFLIISALTLAIFLPSMFSLFGGWFSPDIIGRCYRCRIYRSGVKGYHYLNILFPRSFNYFLFVGFSFNKYRGLLCKFVFTHTWELVRGRQSISLA